MAGSRSTQGAVSTRLPSSDPLAWLVGLQKTPFSTELAAAALGLGLHPDTSSLIQRAWQRFADETSGIAAAHAAIDWRGLPAADVVGGCLAAQLVGNHRSQSLRDLSEDWRGPLYYLCLIALGVTNERGLDHLSPALFVAECELAGPRFWGEFCWRANQHVGFNAAFLLLGAKLERAGDDEATRIALKALKKAIWGRGGIPSGMEPELDGQIFLAAQQEWGQLHPATALSRALDGQFNSIVPAVRHDLLDDLRGSGRRTSRESFEIEFKADSVSATTSGMDDRVAAFDDLRERLLQLKESDPAQAPLIQKVLEGHPQKELARLFGVSVRTIQTRLKKLDQS